MAPAVHNLTEEEMLALLRARYTEQHGNGEAWAFVPKVRNAAGFNATRTCDAIAMNLWPSRGLLIHGFEVKVSRSDWLRELKNPAKAEGFTPLVDRWWLAVSNRTIVEAGELPEGWGLLVAKSRTRLACEVEPTPLHGPTTASSPLPPGFDRGALAALLRQASRVASATPEEIKEAVEAERARAAAEDERRGESWKNMHDDVQSRVRRFEQAAGVSLADWARAKPEEVGAALRVVLAGSDAVAEARGRLERIRKQAQGTVEYLDGILEPLSPPEPVAVASDEDIDF